MSRYNSYGNRGFFGFDSGTTVIAIIVAFAIVSLAIVGCGSYYHDQSVTVHVNDKESVSTHDGHEYRVYTPGPTYVMKDSIIKGRLNTADDYSHLIVGKTYQCNAFGWRLPLFSSFKNLHDCKLVSS